MHNLDVNKKGETLRTNMVSKEVATSQVTFRSLTTRLGSYLLVYKSTEENGT